jgi:hypothetical protein
MHLKIQIFVALYILSTKHTECSVTPVAISLMLLWSVVVLSSPPAARLLKAVAAELLDAVAAKLLDRIAR